MTVPKSTDTTTAVAVVVAAAADIASAATQGGVDKRARVAVVAAPRWNTEGRSSRGQDTCSSNSNSSNSNVKSVSVSVSAKAQNAEEEEFVLPDLNMDSDHES